ncbi:DUF262 domain-containing protein [Flavobacterium limi]|uniref:GmrSD restriction endonucleases N-terminal domain-containing protein n=1 Tax=Flavobacterium limi TaxID=2045105 RepID=A0ABQ1V0E2_9FLAO|nr:DUF262 domain-containing protein [Flavobacterium limi]GGF30049.1 hypothetical protein GCM10011518_44120 [Flavobacterium limi]
MEKKLDIINNWNLKKVFDELENGNMKIPKFQRGYVWERSKIVKLLNSIHKQYPIGSFFIWSASKDDYTTFTREIEGLDLPKKPYSNEYSFILDGQQRITSLYVALRGKTLNDIDYSTICFNVEKGIFQVPRLKTEKHNIPAYKLFDTAEYGNVLKDYVMYDLENKTNLLQKWSECQQIFSDYPISIIKTLKMDLEEVVDIFERINQGGKRLSLFDLVHASTWSPDFDLRQKINKFNSEENVKIFGSIENEVFTQSLALNVFNDSTNQNQLKLTAEHCKKEWDKTAESIKKAIDYVKSFGVSFSSYLPYNSFISVIQYYFYQTQGSSIKSKHKKLIEDWFWTATFSQHYSSSSLTKMKEDAEWIKDLVNNLDTPRTFNVLLNLKDITRVRMQNKSVIKNGIMCLMSLKQPKDFDNGNIVHLDKTNLSKSNSKENHHFFPYSLKENFGTDANGINSILNFVLITARLNREISNKLPSKYIVEYSSENPDIQKHLDTHFISERAYKSILEDDYEGFTKLRGKEILKEINDKTQFVINNESKPEIDQESA